ncbi:ATP synthase subunit delta, mitochondrial [Alligator mississippiensis]|uniref:ATP synthase F(1) complex subunit delta, mitochondrial n=1 Tax=Alligator mississippiensis TaxID=8496 RepID=A0A151P6Q9_ALLMI|nr:ATP synthase subunit delta, mitochondrial [Alligator mississippiensis]
MAFTFASPTQVFYNAANVKQVDVPTLTGSFGILAAHVPTLQVLRPGIVTVYAEDGTASKYFVSSGSVTVNADSSVQLLAEEVASMDMLDLAAAKSNLEKALPWSDWGILLLQRPQGGQRIPACRRQRDGGREIPRIH